jgi:predicted nucleic acid-binding protein
VRILVDTNILVRNVNRADPRHPAVSRAIETLASHGAALCICAQNLFEFWVAATRPARANGLDMDPRRVRSEIDGLLSAFTLLEDPHDLLDTWLRLCTTHRVRGKPAHDARLAALMIGTGVETLLTLNGGDFARFAPIKVLDPTAVRS